MAFIALFLLQILPAIGIFMIVKKIVEIFLRRRALQAAFKDFPGPKPHFLYGNTRELSGDFEGLQRMADLANIYPGAYPAWFGPADAHLVSVRSASARAVLSGSDPKDEFSYALLRPWIGDGLLLSQGRKWDRNRRLMTPAFHADILKNYVNVFSESTEVLIDKWLNSTSSEEMFHHISLLTLDSMMKCLFGYQSGCQNEQTRHPYIQSVYDVSELIVQRIVNPIHHFSFIYQFTANGKKFQKACDKIHQHSELIIQERKRVMKTETKGSRNTDFLDILLTAKDSEGIGLTDQEVRDEVDTFMFEGHDSTASTISWCLYNLAKHNEWQKKCRSEIIEKIGKTKKITWADIDNLDCLMSCLHESMRLYPAVPNFSRCLERDLTLPDGRTIKKGIRVVVSLFAVHRDPEVWGFPNNFDPERFATGRKVSSLYLLPFSIGPRSCIGQQFALTQIKVVLCELLRNFHFELDPEREAIPEALLILRSKNGLYLKVKPL